jgi:hypothetical protein
MESMEFLGFGLYAWITIVTVLTMFTVLLFVVVAGLTYTGVLQWIVKNLLGQPKTYTKAVRPPTCWSMPLAATALVTSCVSAC